MTSARWASAARSLAKGLAVGLLLGLAGCASLPPPPAATGGPLGLHVDCRGEATASPTVILESGAFGTSADWDFVLADLAKGGRVCAYDRAGVGASPPRPGGDESVTAIARELAGLLDGMGETRPVILVGHSNGALYAETFAAMWPARVAGLVYVNGVTSNDLDDPVLVGYLNQERHLSELAVDAANLGLAPIGAGGMVKAEGLEGEAAASKRAALTNLPSLRIARDEDRAIVPGLTVTRELGGSPPAIATVVIVGESRPDLFSSKAWRAAEIVPAEHAGRSWILDAVGATHTSPLARDRAWIVAAVDWLRSLSGDK